MIQETTYVVYYMYMKKSRAETYDNLAAALKCAEDLRKRAQADKHIAFITMVGENASRVGKDGVDEVKDGKTPDGVPYTWNKASRIGATKR